ncbi:MAG: PAS domain S-box protein, partial [Ignavibacteria bacterium]|nr:PAS domain S-box protein [Ignavibacteria bacterium]
NSDEIRIFEYSATRIFTDDSKLLVNSLLRNITNKVAEEELKKSKDALLEGVARAMNILLTSQDFNESVNKALEILGSTTDVDRIYIFEYHKDPDTNETVMSQRFEWVREGVEPQIDNPVLQNLPVNLPGTIRVYELNVNGKPFSGLVKDFLPEEKEILEPQGIKSLLILPIMIEEKCWGFIGFDDCQRERIWSRQEELILIATAAGIGGAIEQELAKKELHTSKDKLIEANTFLNSLLDSSSFIAIVLTDLRGKILYWNTGAENLFQYKAEEVVELRNALILAPKDENTTHTILEIQKHILAEKSPINREVIMKRKDGKKIWISLTASPKLDKNGNVIGLLGIGENITTKKEVERQLEISRENLRLLSAHLQTIREEERTIISREIHDQLGQNLTGLRFDLTWLLNRINKKDAQLIKRINLMSELIDHTIESVQKLSTQLRPAILDDLGLEAALEWQAEDFQRRSGIKCIFKNSIKDLTLNHTVSTSIFRIFQETLTNIMRHAEATLVEISLSKIDSILQLEIKDNGKGIKPNKLEDPRSLGIIGMRERARLIGGELNIIGNPNLGTSVILTVDLNNQEK